MEEKEGRRRKASTKVMIVLVKGVEGELKQGETSSSIRANRVNGVILMIGREKSNETKRSCLASLRTWAKGRALSL